MSTEAERIAEYQRGFNDAAAGRGFAPNGNFFYACGFLDSQTGRAARLK